MLTLSPAEARSVLLHAAGFGRSPGPSATASAPCRDLLDALGVIQLDPLDRVGTNADLVAFARIPSARLGDVYRETAGYGFEHFAKERCLISPRYFPHYRAQGVETPWWRNSERMLKLDEGLLTDVLVEVKERGALTTREMEDRGKTEPMDWSGWKSTSSRSALAAEVLWTRCELVVSGRKGRSERIYDLPERALGEWATLAPAGRFDVEMVVERVRTAGLLSRQAGAHWSILAGARTDGTIGRLLESGRIVEVRVGKRVYLAMGERSGTGEQGAAEQGVAEQGAWGRPAPEVEPVVIGPLDSLIWDRELVREAFGFDYLWEVYKPAAKRQYGYYVCPILAGDALIGRVEAVRETTREKGPGGAVRTLLKVLGRWGDVPDSAVERLAMQNGAVLAGVAG